MPLRLGLVALAAVFGYRLLSMTRTSRSPSSHPIATRRRERRPRSGLDSRDSWTVAAAAAIAGAAAEAAPDDPVSPELALVDSSLRDRLILDVAASNAQPPTPIPPSPPEPATKKGKRTRRILAGAALLLTAAIAVAVGFRIVTEHRKDSPRSTVSTQAPLSPSPSAAGAPTGRNFVWAPVREASRYAVEIRRNNNIIYAATTSLPHVTVPSRWKRDGRTIVLSPGTYQWYVWPVTGSGAHSRRGAAIVAASFSVAH